MKLVQPLIAFTFVVTAMSGSPALGHEGDNDAFSEGTGELHEVHVDEDGQTAIGIKLQPATRSVVREAIITTGEVHASETQSFDVTSTVSGAVKSVFAKKGDFVRAGQPLVMVHSIDAASTFTELFNARSQMMADIARTRTDFKAQIAVQSKELELTKQTYERQEILVKEGIAAPKDFHAAKNAYEKALVQLESSKQKSKEEIALREQQLNVKLKAGRGQLMIMGLSDTAISEAFKAGVVNTELPIRAPVSGTITNRTVTLGQHLDASQSVFSIVNLSPIWVMIDVFQEQLQKVVPGQKVQLETPSGQILSGAIENISPIVDPEKKTVHVRIVTDNKQGMLKPGMFVNASILLGGSTVGNVTVPNNAIVEHQERQLVFVQEHDHFAPKYIHKGFQSGTATEILSGLDIGDKVVVQGATQLKAQAMRPEGGVHHDEHGEHDEHEEAGGNKEGGTSEKASQPEKEAEVDELGHGAADEHGHGAKASAKPEVNVLLAFVAGAVSVLLFVGIVIVIVYVRTLSKSQESSQITDRTKPQVPERVE